MKFPHLTLIPLLFAIGTAPMLAQQSSPDSDAESEQMAEFVVPEGFELKILEPTGGKISRPSGWFYREAHDDVSFKWVLAKEDPDSGPYTTGVRIQLIVGLEEKAGKSAQRFVEEFLEDKRANAKVLSECDSQAQGLLVRACIVTEEKIASASTELPFQIRYSVFWGQTLDVAVFAISGTPQELWEENAPIFDEIEKFQLIDLERFAEKKD